MNRVLVNILGYIAAAVLFLWLLCCTGCLPGYIWRSQEGNYYMVAPGINENQDQNQIQLNPHTHY